MPTFGDFETIDEPLESREDSRHFTRVWQARRISVQDGRLYAVKCYIPRRGRRAEPASGETLEEHRSLEYIEGVKQIKKAAAGGQPCLTPIHEFGLTPTGDGAWYATDFYGDATPVLPRTLRSYITRGGKVDAEALRHTIYSIVRGCLVLKRSRGCSHGNLKTTNVFRAGKPRALRKTLLVLGDAFPVAPLLLGQLDPQNKLEVGALLNATVEVHDLQAIGQLILQLVEVRLLTREGDYDFPIIPAPAWNALGKHGERWRQLCNRLLDPNLSLESFNLELLEKELRPGLVSSHAPMAAAAAAVLCLAGAGLYFGLGAYKKSQADHRRHLYEGDLNDARSALATSESDPTNILQALRLVDDALRILPSDTDATQLKTEAELKRDSLFEKAFSAGTNELAANKFEASAAQLQIAATLKPDDADARRLRDQAQAKFNAVQDAIRQKAAFDTAMSKGHTLYSQNDFDNALAAAMTALSINPNDADAQRLRDESQAKINANKDAIRQKAAFDTAMTKGHTLYAQGDFDNALAAATTALSINPNDADAQRLRDDSQAKINANKDALQRKAAFDTAMTKGHTLYAQGDFDNALAAATTALSINPNDADAQRLRDDSQAKINANKDALQRKAAFVSALAKGHTLYAQGDFDNALAAATTALSINPNDADAQRLRDDSQAKINANKDALQRKAAFVSALAKGHTLYAQGDFDNALAAATTALSINPNDADAQRLRDDAQAKINANKDALQRKAAFDTAMTKGHTLYAQGDFDNALAAATTALSINPNDADAQRLRDESQAKINANKDALQRKAAFDTAMTKGHTLYAQGDFDNALAAATTALSINPNDADAQRLRDDAQAKINANIQASQQKAAFDAAMTKGRALYAKGDFTNALAAALTALSIRASDADAQHLRDEIRVAIESAFKRAFETGQQAASEGKKDEADRQLERMKSLKPADPEVGELVAAIANMAKPPTPLKRPQATNFASIFGQTLPNLDFVWVDALGPAGAYASVNELSWQQYHDLVGIDQPLNPLLKPNSPANLSLDQAKAFVHLLNTKAGDKKFSFRLPTLQEYKILSGVPDFAAISKMVTDDTSAGESFKRPGNYRPRDIAALPTVNKLGLRNVIGNVREWSSDGLPFGNSYSWGQSGVNSLTAQPLPDEPIGVRLIGEPKN